MQEIQIICMQKGSQDWLPCYNVTNPDVSLSQTRDIDCFKLYLSDIGYLYENVVAQMIKASGRDLYYHTWRKEGISK